MEGRHDVRQDESEVTRIINFVLVQTSVMQEPGAVLRSLLEKYLQEHASLSFLFAEPPCIKLTKAMLLLLKEQRGDPMPNLIWHLNSVSTQIKAQWDIVLWLSAYFSVYQHYSVHLDEVCAQLFVVKDVWHAIQQQYFTSIFLDLQTANDAISLAAFQALMDLRQHIPDVHRPLLANTIQANLQPPALKTFKLAILKQIESIYQWLSFDQTVRAQLLERLLKFTKSEDPQLRTAACLGVIKLHEAMDAKNLLAHIDKFIKQLNPVCMNQCLTKTCHALGMLLPIIPKNKCLEVVKCLLPTMQYERKPVATIVQATFWKFVQHIPSNDMHEIMNDYARGFLSEEDVFYAAALDDVAGMMYSIPVNLRGEAINYVQAIVGDKNHPYSLRQLAITTLEKLRFIFFSDDCKSVTKQLLQLVADTTENIAVRAQALKSLAQMSNNMIFADANYTVSLLLNAKTEVKRSNSFKVLVIDLLPKIVMHFGGSEYAVVKKYLLNELHGPDENLLIKCHAVQGLRQLAHVDCADAIMIDITPFIEKLDNHIMNKNMLLIASTCDLLRQLKPFLSCSDRANLINYLLIKLTNNSCSHKIFILLTYYISDMSIDQKINALSLLRSLANEEVNCHHYAKKLFIQIYHAYRTDMTVNILRRCPEQERREGLELPNHVIQHIMRLAN